MVAHRDKDRPRNLKSGAHGGGGTLTARHAASQTLILAQIEGLRVEADSKRSGFEAYRSRINGYMSRVDERL